MKLLRSLADLVTLPFRALAALPFQALYFVGLVTREVANLLLLRPVLALANERGASGMSASMTALIFGVIIIVVGLVLETTILSRASTAGSDASIGSFAGARALNDLVPLVYNAAIVIMGVGLIGLGALGMTGRGPLKKS